MRRPGPLQRGGGRFYKWKESPLPPQESEPSKALSTENPREGSQYRGTSVCSLGPLLRLGAVRGSGRLALEEGAGLALAGAPERKPRFSVSASLLLPQFYMRTN